MKRIQTAFSRCEVCAVCAVRLLHDVDGQTAAGRRQRLGPDRRSSRYDARSTGQSSSAVHLHRRKRVDAVPVLLVVPIFVHSRHRHGASTYGGLDKTTGRLDRGRHCMPRFRHAEPSRETIQGHGPYTGEELDVFVDGRHDLPLRRQHVVRVHTTYVVAAVS